MAHFFLGNENSDPLTAEWENPRKVVIVREWDPQNDLIIQVKDLYTNCPEHKDPYEPINTMESYRPRFFFRISLSSVGSKLPTKKIS